MKILADLCWTLGGNFGLKILMHILLQHWWNSLVPSRLFEGILGVCYSFQQTEGLYWPKPLEKDRSLGVDKILDYFYTRNLCFRWSKFQLQVRLKPPFQFPGFKVLDTPPCFRFLWNWRLGPSHPNFLRPEVGKIALIFRRNVYEENCSD